MLVFQSARGRVVKLLDPAAMCKIQLIGTITPPISFETQFSIVTRMTLSQQVNLQFLHTIGSGIYVYTFGDRMGQMSLSGLAFSCACPPTDSTLSSPGVELIYNWFKDNRASKKQAPIRTTIGKTPIEGFVTAFTSDVVDPASGLVQWGITMATLPEDI